MKKNGKKLSIWGILALIAIYIILWKVGVIAPQSVSGGGGTQVS